MWDLWSTLNPHGILGPPLGLGTDDGICLAAGEAVRPSTLPNDEECPESHDDVQCRQDVSDTALCFLQTNHHSLEELHSSRLPRLPAPKAGFRQTTAVEWYVGLAVFLLLLFFL